MSLLSSMDITSPIGSVSDSSSSFEELESKYSVISQNLNFFCWFSWKFLFGEFSDPNESIHPCYTSSCNFTGKNGFKGNMIINFISQKSHFFTLFTTNALSDIEIMVIFELPICDNQFKVLVIVCERRTKEIEGKRGKTMLLCQKKLCFCKHYNPWTLSPGLP